MKRRRVAGLLLVLLVIGSGCGSIEFPGFPQTRAYVVGAVAEIGATGNYAFVDFENILIDGRPLSGTPRLRTGEVLEVHQSSQRAVLVDVERTVVSGRTYDYNVLVGGGLDTGTRGQMYIPSGDPVQPAMEFGWALFWGIRPRFLGRWVEVITESTDVAFQMVDAPVYAERVFLIKGGPVTVRCLTGSDTERINNPGEYVEATQTALGLCEISTPAVPPAAIVTSFLDPAKAQAQAAGWVP